MDGLPVVSLLPAATDHKQPWQTSHKSFHKVYLYKC
jgi:hypothetical protein